MKIQFCHPSLPIPSFLFPFEKVFCLLLSIFIPYLVFLDETMEFLYTLMMGLILLSFEEFKILIGIIGAVRQNRSDLFVVVAIQDMFNQFLHHFSIMHLIIRYFLRKDFLGLDVYRNMDFEITTILFLSYAPLLYIHCSLLLP